MSNCIDLHHYTVRFGQEEIDSRAFESFLATAEKEINGCNCASEEVDRELDTAWWFLCENTTVDEDSITIRFGRGRSTHTWRDFKATLKLLSKFIKNPVKHIFAVADEFDGFDTLDEIVVNFKEGTINAILRVNTLRALE